MRDRLRRRERLAGDEGASLLAVLIVVGVLSVILAAVTTFGATAEFTTVQLHSQAKTTYSADSGLDAAINAASRDSTWGVDDGSNTCKQLTLPASSQGVNALGVDVTCQYWPGSGQINTGGGVTDKNRPREAILTLPLAGDNGFTQQSQNDLKVKGNVYAGGDVKMGGVGATMTVTGDVKARGVCDTGVTATGTKTCDAGTVAYPTDPANDSDSTYAATWVRPIVDLPPLHQTVPSSCPGGVVALSPGRYTDAAGLSALTSGGCHGLVYFRPGNYYFDFGTSSSGTTWTVNDPAVTIVGGLVNGWTYGDLPSLFNPLLGCAGNDVNQLANSGVAFVFGGASRINVTADNAIELCAQPQSTKQEIAVWGVKNDTSTTQTDSFAGASATSPSASPNTTTFSAPSNALATETPAQTSNATLSTTTTTTAQATLALSGFTLASLPSTATINSVSARVIHQDTGSAADLAKFTFKLASGSVTNAPGYTQRSTLTADTFTLNPADFTPGAAAPGITITASEGKATGGPGSTRTVTEKIDLVELRVNYTIPGLTGESGTCITTTTSCPLIGTSGAQAQNIFIRGTTYAPLAILNVHLTLQSDQAFSRGVVARTVTANITPASTYDGSVFGLPDIIVVTGQNPRKITFTARIGGTVIGTAVVRIDDTVTPVDVKLLSWNINH